jgi:hypothetical protein
MEADVPDVPTKRKCPPLSHPKGPVCNGMIGQCRGKPLFSAVMNARRLALTTLVIVISGTSALPQASASAAAIPRGSWATLASGGDNSHNKSHIILHIGNGKNNRASNTLLSPTINHGLQQISNTNVSGSTNTQAAFCKKKTHVCRISQKLWVDHW